VREVASIVFTNHAVPALKVAAFEAGADYFLDKAKDWEALSRIVRELAESEASA
jgi:DNA-binding NarL/FixJ family response regulator